MLRGCRARAIAAGGLDHHIHSELAPRELGDLGLCERLDRTAGYEQVPGGGLNGAGKRSVNGVVAQQVRQRGSVGEIVDRDDLQGGFLLVRDPQHAASDAAEAVDGNSNGHLASSCSYLGGNAPGSGCSTARYARPPAVS